MSDISTPPPAAAPRRPTAPLWLVLVAFFVLVCILVLMGLGLTRLSPSALKIGSPAPEFNLTPFNGQTVSLSGLKGKVVLVNFWASWCGPCLSEAPLLEQAWQKYKPGGQVVFLGVDYVDTEGLALAFIKKYGLTFLNGPDLRSEISTLYHITGVPETYIIDQQGNLAYLKIGPFDSLEEISTLIDKILAGQGGE